MLDDLQTALVTSDAGTTFYFDRQTGETVIVAEELDDVIGMPSREDVEDGVVAGRLIQIIPVSSSVEYRWMVEFTGTVADDRLRDRLEVALDGRGPFRRFKNALSYHPDERERWFALRDARLREVAREWLAAHGIRAPSPPERRAP